MELENKIKQKLRLRGFTEKQLLNNRGLIGATIDEVTLILVKNLAIHDVSKSVVCGNCDGWGYTVDENGRRKDHCNECE